MRRELTPIKGTAGKEFDHLALRIDLEDIGLADLSFGDNFLEPLRLSEMEQQDAARGLRLIDAGECWRLERRQPAARSFVLKMIPDISEQVDAKARIIGYGYGPKYADIELIFNLALVWAWN